MILLNDLYSLSSHFNFTEDRSRNCIHGTHKGFNMLIKGNEQNECFIFTTWARKGALSNKSAEQWFSEYTANPAIDFIKATDVNNYTIAAVIAADESTEGNIRRLTSFMHEITSFLNSNYYSNACAQCGSAVGAEMTVDSDGQWVQLCKMCAEKEEDEAKQNNVNQQPLVNEQPQQPMFGTNDFANPVQSVQNTYNTQPNITSLPTPQTTTDTTIGVFGVGAMGAVGAVDMQQGSVPMGTKLASTTDTMGSIDPATAPESTGFTTAEDLAALEPPTASSFSNDYTVPPIANDFRADPSYTKAPATFTPIARNAENVDVASNPLMGFVGAVLFALIACVIWVLIGMMGKISYIGGLAMGFFTVTGYKLLGKKFDVYGIISCIVVIALAVLGSNIFIIVLELFGDAEIKLIITREYGYDSFMALFFNFFTFMGRMADPSVVRDPLIHNLVIGYLLSGVGFCVVAIPAFKERNY